MRKKEDLILFGKNFGKFEDSPGGYGGDGFHVHINKVKPSRQLINLFEPLLRTANLIDITINYSIGEIEFTNSLNDEILFSCSLFYILDKMK